MHYVTSSIYLKLFNNGVYLYIYKKLFKINHEHNYYAYILDCVSL